MAVVTVDSYSESNQSSGRAFGAPGDQELYVGQAFTCTYGITLDSCKFYIKRPPVLGGGTIYAQVYNFTGTYGTNAYQTGSALATSAGVAVSTIGADYSLITFSFSGANRITLATGGQYIISLYYSYKAATDDIVAVGLDISSSSHSGNLSYYYSSSWTTSTDDFCFYVYGSSTTPTVTTQACSGVTHNAAVGNGNITATGGVAVTRRGFCYVEGTSGDPTTSDSTVYDDGTFNTGAYTKDITGLSASTGYRVRSYCVNAEGTSYGTTVQLTTQSADGPVVSTTTTSILKKNCALVGGNVTDSGTEPVTERGIYYGTTEETQATKIAQGSGEGEYPVFMTGLDAETTYYFKAFATSTVSTSYGDILHFTTGNSLSVEDTAYLPPFNKG